MKQLSSLFSFLPDIVSYLILAAVAVLTAFLITHFKYKQLKLSFGLLFLSIVLLGFAFASIDPFLHPWDEQYHALVAKNMLNHPFHPTLMEGPHWKADRANWISHNIWLHKQPLFLWQIALSMKCFGVNILAVRLPSILLHAGTTVLIFSISKRFCNHFYAALVGVLYGFCAIILDQVSGAQGMDHNDIAFIFYANASFWAWLKYQDTKNVKWAIAVGLFSGGAVLCKWLVGLVVFAGWGAVHVAFNWKNKREWMSIAIAVGVACAVVLPWQIYCYAMFPSEYQREIAYNSLHYFQTIENHGGQWYFYFDGMKNLFGGGELVRILVLLGVGVMIWKAITNKDSNYLFVSVVFLIVYGFFMSASTKLPGYVFIVAGIGFIFLITPIQLITDWIRKKKNWGVHWILSSLIVLLILSLQFHARGVVDRHYYLAPNNVNRWRFEQTYAKQIISKEKRKEAYFLIKNTTVPNAAALRFHTGREIYIWQPHLEGKECVIIDCKASTR